MVDAVGPRDAAEVAGVDAVKDGDVHAVFIGVRTALMVGVNAAAFAEPVFGGPGAELVEGQVILSLQDADAGQRSRDDNRPPCGDRTNSRSAGRL